MAMKNSRVRNFWDLTTNQVVKILGVNKSRFQQWVRLGYIKPYHPAEASGKNHYFIKEDLYIISLFIFLHNLGFNRWIASKWSKFFSHHELSDIASDETDFYLLITGDPSKRDKKRDKKNWNKDIKAEIYPGPIDKLHERIQNNPVLLIINLKNIQRDIDKIVDNQMI